MNENILLIGKDTSFMQTLTQRIASYDITVHFAQSAPDALDIVQREDIDVVVVNVNDLGVEGVIILDSIKKRSPLTESIILTSPATIHCSIEGMKRGAFADLLIPFDNEDLVAKVRQAGARRSIREQKKKRSLLGKFEDFMVSATFAESGNFEAARQILKSSQEPRPKNKKEHKDEES